MVISVLHCAQFRSLLKLFKIKKKCTKKEETANKSKKKENIGKFRSVIWLCSIEMRLRVDHSRIDTIRTFM